MHRPVAFLAVVAIMTCVAAQAAEVLSCDFSAPLHSPWLKLVGDAKVENGVLKTAAQADFKRSAMTVGPLPMEGATWLIEYDFMPVTLGEQCQAFASFTPSPKSYLAFVQRYGHMQLWTTTDGTYARRSRSDHWLQPDTWYHVTIRLTATTIQFWLKERNNGGLWDSGLTKIDNLGMETTFGLVDMASAPVGGTQWDNLRIATDSPDLAAKFKQLTRQMQGKQ